MEEIMPTRITASLIILGLWASLAGCGSTQWGVTPESSRIRIFPDSVPAGSADLTLAIGGANFAGPPCPTCDTASEVVWSMNGVNTKLATQFISSTQLIAVVPAALLTSPGSANVFVQTLAGLSRGIRNAEVVAATGAAIFTIITFDPERLAITSLSPASAAAGGADQVLSVTGANFITPDHPHKRNRVVWSAHGDTFLSTTFVSSTQLTAVVPASLLANPVTAQVRVEIWDTQGDVAMDRSNSLNFVITP